MPLCLTTVVEIMEVSTKNVKNQLNTISKEFEKSARPISFSYLSKVCKLNKCDLLFVFNCMLKIICKLLH